ncbi:hyaluronidase-2-like [Sinocyclocheilus anshuiensis]|uniref:hyaluronidase-2-like n=1 Tax=Sinocyclocheilus anshuiensis TaxID=1608454 RepID=UPI0007BA8D8A|nr:PREDICTED: hyaluronidase-2-like [Sinocyclocheilus anshuiensis]
MAYWIQLRWRIWLLVPLALDHLALAEDMKPTRWPLYPQKPVVLVWNAPTEDCSPRHNVHFQLDQFQIVASPNEGFTKQNLTIFYKDCLGLYPCFEAGVAINGGLPQISSLTHHLEKMPEGIAKYIRDPSARGLAVIDWEEWHPENRKGATTHHTTPAHFLQIKNQSLIPLFVSAQMDLESTIGESVALGAAGIVLWGDAAYASSNDTCSSLNQYLRGPLGLYLLNVSTAAEHCSCFLCSSHGRCLRRHPDTDTDTYLYLDPQTHTIVGQGSELRVKGDLSVEEQQRMSEDFQCQCFSGYQGERCDLEDPLQQ